MPFDPEQADHAQWYDFLFTAIQSERFLHKQVMGNDVPFFVFPYPVACSEEMERIVQQLVNRLHQNGRRILHVNLYELAIQLLQERGIWGQILDIEPTLGKDELLELLQGVLDPEAHLIPAIERRMEKTKGLEVLLLSGAGQVFPYLRSHAVLSNLEAVAGDVPTLLFFPGKYIQSLAMGASLDLFDKFHDDRYYRAYNICQLA